MNEDKKRILQRHKEDYLYKKVGLEIEMELLSQYQDGDAYATTKELSGLLKKEIIKTVTVGQRRQWLKTQIVAIDRILNIIDKLLNA